MRGFNGNLVGADVSTVTLAGTVRDSADAPLARTVRLHDRNGVLLQTAVSAPATGAWAMSQNGSALDRFEVVVMGAAGEQSIIINDL